jgi:hypothetical protein
VKNISLHVAVDHPLVTVDQSLKGTLGSSIGCILGPSSIDLKLKNVIGTRGISMRAWETRGLLNLLILAIIAVVEKTTVLAETPIRLNAIDQNPRLNNYFGINATVGLSN